MATITIKDILDIQLKDEELTRPYTNNPTVYSLINKISKTISAVPIYLYREGNKKQMQKYSLRPNNVKIDEKSPWHRLINKPNMIQSGQDFIKLMLTYCLLSPGDCFILCLNANNQKVATEDEIPVNMYVIAGSAVQEVKEVGPDGFHIFKYWSYNGVNYKPFQLRQFKLDSNPYNYMRGIDPLTSATLTLTHDQLTNKFNNAFFKNGAAPGGILYTDHTLGVDKKKEYQQQWESRHRGSENTNKVAVLDGGLKYQEVGTNHKDMEFLESKKFNIDTFCTIYDTPKFILGMTESINNAVSQIVARNWWLDNLIPKIRKIESWFESEFFSNNPNEWLAFDLSVVEAIRPDLDAKLAIARKLYELGYPINDINDRLELGMANQEYGDIQFLAPGFTSIKQSLETPIPGASDPSLKGQEGRPKDASVIVKNFIYKMRKFALEDKDLSILSDEAIALGIDINSFNEIVNNIPKINKTEIRDYFNTISKTLQKYTKGKQC